MDVVEWAQVASTLVSAGGIIAVVRWAVVDRRRADERAEEARLEQLVQAQESRAYSQRLAAQGADAELVLRVALSFERHQAGDPTAAAECKALLLAVRDRLPVTRLFYLGGAGWQPADNPRIEALANFYGLPVGADLARREIRHELQGTAFTIHGGQNGGPPLPAAEPTPSLPPLPDGRRQLLLRMRKPGRHARKAATH